MGLARAGSADQDQVALLGDEAAAGEIAHQGLVDRRVLNAKSSTSLASGSLAIASWYLIERACFPRSRH